VRFAGFVPSVLRGHACDDCRRRPVDAWTADAWQSSWGMFSAENPDLGGKIGDINAAPDAASRKQLGNTANRD